MKPEKIQLKTAVVCCLSLFFLLSCAGTPKSPQYISPSLAEKPLTTLGIMPITYNERYAEPRDVRLSRQILRNTENLLKTKGYRTVILNKPALALQENQADPMKMEPSQISQDVPAAVDGIIVIHVRSHFGLSITERAPQAMGPSINLNADARLISADSSKELWRDSGAGRSFSKSNFLRHTQFTVRLEQATRSLVNNLFSTLPAKAD